MATTFDEFGNIVEVVTGEEQTNQQNREYISSGGIDDDSGSIQRFDDGSSIQTFDDGSTLVIDSDGNTSSTPAPPPFANAGTTQSGKSGTSAGKTATAKPGKRTQNPLGNFSSYTYQISLYMITPDAYDAFIQSGRKNINAFQDVNNSGNGVYLVAQSGGINNTTSKRAPGFDQDFYIDDLKIKQAINGKDVGAATNTTQMSFTVTEPYGFSFITRLKKAADALSKVTRSKNYKDLTNATRQFFIVGIRFQGYDLNGNLINSKDIPGTDGDPQGNAYGIFERFFDILITGLKFKIEGKSVTYNITAASVTTGVPFGVKRGIIYQGAKVVANNVYNALMGNNAANQGLLAKLNNDQKKLLKEKSIEIANVWDVKFLGDANTEIGLASIVNSDDIEKSRMPMSKTTNTSQVNVATESKSPPDVTSKEITVPGGTPILQAVNQIVLQSDFLTKALTKVYNSDLTPDPKQGNNEIVNDSKNQIKWYTMTAEIQTLGWDKLVSDFAYRTTYVIQTYDTPIVLSAYAKRLPKYYGPHKRYEYWFTGKNSEIIRYEQNMDNTFFNVALDPNGSPASQGGSTDSPTTVGPQDQPNQGAINLSLEAQNSYMTSLFDPGAYAMAKIQILGDPDFLMQPSPSSINALYNKFYGTDGFTINPNGGQVFVEVNFKEPTDYYNKDGLLSINESILFWKYPADVTADIKQRGGGVSYMVHSCTSTFSKGKFEQELVCSINTFGNSNGSTDSSPANEREDAAAVDAEFNNRSGTNSNATTESGSSTTSEDTNNTTETETTSDGFENYSGNLPTDQQTIETENGPVQDDDAAKDTEGSNDDEGGRED